MLLRNGETFLKPRIWDGSVVPKFSSENLGLQNRPRKLGLGKLVESLITPQRVAHFVEMWYACALRVYGSSWLSRIRLAVRSGVASYGALGYVLASTSNNVIFSFLWSKSDSQANYLSIV